MSSAPRPHLQIGVIAPHHVTRRGLESLLEDAGDVEVAASARSLGALPAGPHHPVPDALVMDLDTRTPAWLALSAVPRRFASSAVLGITRHGDAATARSTLDHGLGGCVCLDVGAAELRRAVGMVADGRRYVDPRLGAAFAVAPPELLSPRDRTIVELVASGYANRQIAARLGIGLRAVETSRAQLASRLDLPDRPAYVRYALNAGILRAGT